jgi:hypothetical protein
MPAQGASNLAHARKLDSRFRGNDKDGQATASATRFETNCMGCGRTDAA